MLTNILAYNKAWSNGRGAVRDRTGVVGIYRPHDDCIVCTMYIPSIATAYYARLWFSPVSGSRTYLCTNCLLFTLCDTITIVTWSAGVSVLISAFFIVVSSLCRVEVRRYILIFETKYRCLLYFNVLLNIRCNR